MMRFPWLSLAVALALGLLACKTRELAPVVNHYDAPPFPTDFPALPTSLRPAGIVTGRRMAAVTAPGEVTQAPAPAWEWVQLDWNPHAATVPVFVTQHSAFLWETKPSQFNLYSAPTPNGPWRYVTNVAAPPVRMPLDAPQMFFWLVATNHGRTSLTPPL